MTVNCVFGSSVSGGRRNEAQKLLVKLDYKRPCVPSAKVQSTPCTAVTLRITEGDVIGLCPVAMEPMNSMLKSSLGEAEGQSE